MDHVRFDLNPTCYYYKASNDTSDSFRNVLQESMDRTRGECAFLQTKPQTQLDITIRVFDECRRHDISVIFGNLGRHPLLLTYFLDSVFTSQESVGVVSNYEIDSPYKIGPPIPSLDFLFLIEPYFGYSVVKPLYVKHLIVVTSHLVLNLTACHMTKLYLGPSNESQPVACKTLKSFKPPVFHDGKINQIPPKVRVHLDVTDAKSAHEAYLRLLTGQEIARDRIITMQLSSRDYQRVQKNIEKSRNKVATLGWKEDWIKRYLTFFENNVEENIILERPSTSV